MAFACWAACSSVGGNDGATGIDDRTDLASAAALRRLARREPRRRTMQRLLALANALDGLSRADSARAAGIERQGLRDAVVRSDAEGLAGLVDRPAGRQPERLTEGEPSSWTLWDRCGFIEARFGKTMLPQSMSRVMRRLGLSRQKARPVLPAAR